MPASTKPSDFRDPKQYKDLLFDLTLAYMKSPEFSTLSDQERIHVTDCIEEMKMLLCEKAE
jgi:hypothetical protein